MTDYVFAVIPLVNKARVFLVRSKSHPGQRHVVDLGRCTCTCPRQKFIRASDKLCEHQELAAAFEQEQREAQALMPITTERAVARAA